MLIDWPRIHETRGISLGAMSLAPFSFAYGLGVRVNMAIRGKIRSKALPGFVVSIGNITAGGTGKTPAACMLAEWAKRQGYKVAILLRGYGRESKEKVLEVSDGNAINASPREAGDEAVLIAKRVEGVPVVVSKNRYLAGLWAHNRYGANFFILDDAFQHVALERHMDVVLLDASSPFGNGHLLPWGPLREPIAHLKRADVFIITRIGNRRSDNESETRELLAREFPGKPRFESEHVPKKAFFPAEKKEYDPKFLNGKRAFAFAGIARPEAFKETLLQLGVQIAGFRSFNDHHAFSRREIEELLSAKDKKRADFLLTTEKDWVRIESLGARFHGLGYLAIGFRFLSGFDEFTSLIKGKAGAQLSV